MKNIIYIALIVMAQAISAEEYNKMAYRHMHDYAAKIKRSEGISMVGIGGSMTASVRTLGPDFTMKRNVDLAEARRIYVRVVQGLMDQINADKKIRPYLHDYPFGSKNVEMIITFDDEFGKLVTGDRVALVGMGKGRIRYKFYDGNTFNEFYRESYEDAVKILENEKGVK